MLRNFIYILFFVIISLFVYHGFFKPNLKNNKKEVVRAPDIGQGAQAVNLSIGDEGRLNFVNETADWIAINKSTYIKVCKIIDIQDGYGLLELMKNNSVFPVDHNAKVLIIGDSKSLLVDNVEMLAQYDLTDMLGKNATEAEKTAYAFAVLREKGVYTGFKIYKVRILEGINTGMAGWVIEREITK